MNQLKKIFFAVAVALGFGLWSASTAFAQCAAPTMVGSLVRSEGTIEVLGNIAIAACNPGTTAGTTATNSDVIITLSPATARWSNYSGAMAVFAGDNAAWGANFCPNAAVADNAGTFACPGISSTLIGGTFVAPIITFPAPNIMRLNFTPNVGAQTFNISGLRVNVAGANLASGAALTAVVLSGGGVGGRTTTLQAAIVNKTLETGSGLGTAPTVASCGPVRTPVTATVAGNPDTTVGNINSIRATFVEGFIRGFRVGAGQEPDLFGAATGTRFRIQLTGVPAGISVWAPEIVTLASLASTGSVAGGATAGVITLVAGAAADGSGGAVVVPVANQFDSITLVGGTATIIYQVTVAPTGLPETISALIALTGLPTTGTGAISGSLGLAPVGPPTAVAARPQFGSVTPGTAATISLCATYLLFPWVVNTGDGAYDTGLAISNTTADAPIGTPTQVGDVRLYFWASTGTNPAPVTLATALAAGRTATGVLSALVTTPFTGYVIAVCNFQLGHGFAFINNPRPGTGGAFSQGYLALSITSPRIGAPAGVAESAGH